MTTHVPETALQLRSVITKDATLELSLARVAVPAPKPDEVVVRVEGSPINPSDLGLLLGPADMRTLKGEGTKENPRVTAQVPQSAMQGLAARLGESMPVGNEGAGVVVRAGDSPEAQALTGKLVAMIGGAMYAQYRVIRASDCMPLPDGTKPAEGASCFVNPLTALGMVETMRREGHSALVHTAAASNLGQMLLRICRNDAVPLVNIVRNAQQAELLRKQGAKHVCDSSSSAFMDALIEALKDTRATLAFDAIGGGKLASQILTGMETAATANAKTFSRYGSSVHKQVYIYGGLDTGPTELTRGYGMVWGLGGWLLTPFLQKIGVEGRQKLQARVVAELTTTFASHYTRTISLRQALEPAVVTDYNRKATGEKYLINPALD